jgi:SsrA-binding protein
MATHNINIKNKPATFEYAIEDRLVAGIMLNGSEIKSVRNSRVSFNDSYCIIDDNELWVKNLHISEYVNTGYIRVDAVRERKLLLHRKEINKWATKVKEKGLTIVPLCMFVDENGRAKLEIGLGRGKKLHDKRESEKTKAIDKEIKRYLK